MKRFSQHRIAFVVASALALAACSGEDGKDGKDGENGEDGVSPTPPVVEVSEVTELNYVSHMIEEGQVTVEFNATDEAGLVINGLEQVGVSVYLAAVTDNGIQRSRDGTVGGSADLETEGASLTLLDNGNYEFVAPMSAVQADTDGIVRLTVGDLRRDPGPIAAAGMLVHKPEETIHTTTTETCYSCHVDFATSDIRHNYYVVQDVDGNTDFVGSCLVCHNNVARDVAEDGSSLDTGGYAKLTMQAMGHINHQKFEMDFQVTNCFTCHATEVMNTNITGNGCSDCHGTNTESVMAMAKSSPAYTSDTSSFDVRQMHADISALNERKAIRAQYSTTASAPYYDDTYTYDDGNGYAGTGGYCIDLKLWDNATDTPVQVNIKNLYDAGELAYTGAYIDGYDLETGSIVARAISRYDTGLGYYDREDGTRSVCYTFIDFGDQSGFAHLAGSTRLTFKDAGWIDSDSEYGVSFTSFAGISELTVSADPAVPHTLVDINEAHGRRFIIDNEACTTCHNNETNYHKNGSYNAGGQDCVACHNNGYDRNAAKSAPGFGPMIHSMHWGVGNALSGNKGQDEDGNNIQNSAASLNADNCVSCHSNGIDMDAIPNRYMLSKSLNDGTSGVMTSPVLANCSACHDSEAALNHMMQNGGELNTVKGDGWYTVPTAESCATCHATGKSFGIDKYHVFER
ncbi:hypothetical protein G3R49_11745 [Shewanella sp. WXL01]|uniref:Outer membrane cytochrome MtrC/MtrF-like domain-containing protein n=1 Tax=Shewanella maritima TaxID=2520507 RepID=A0A411PIW6_9GAMM|nr:MULTISPECIES: cytochrome c3 family protein [Shewanella]NKF51227.1 hypothetical protein [Shewanella sp. WXL01]QBF83541.1 hypothetical protein EXU30_13200 [Shewanella maritima]